MAIARDVMFVRIKPHNPRKGYRLRRYLVFGMKFEEEKGWYKIDRVVKYAGEKIDIIAYLEEVRNSETDPDSALAFDITDEAGAKAIDAKEKKDREKRAAATEPNASQAIDLTASDVQVGESKIVSSVRRGRSVRAARPEEV